MYSKYKRIALLNLCSRMYCTCISWVCMFRSNATKTTIQEIASITLNQSIHFHSSWIIFSKSKPKPESIDSTVSLTDYLFLLFVKSMKCVVDCGSNPIVLVYIINYFISDGNLKCVLQTKLCGDNKWLQIVSSMSFVDYYRTLLLQPN